jgi:hypothetical protein
MGAYLEWKKVEWIFFFCHNYLELKKIKFVVIVFNDYVIVLWD